MIALAAVGALFAGGIVKGVLGIGLPLISMPLLVLVVEVPTAVALMTVPLLVTNVAQSFEAGVPAGTVRRYWPCLVTLPPAMFAGTLLFRALDRATLYMIVGSLLLVVAAQLLLSPKIRIAPNWEGRTGIAAALVSGLLGGLSSMYGPPLALYLVGLRVDKREFVPAISLLYTVGALSLLIAFASTITMSWGLFMASCLINLPAFAGMRFGRAIRDRVDAARFRQAVLAVIGLTGAGLIIQSMGM